MATRRSNGEGTYRQRPNGTWEMRFLLPNGKRKSVYGKTQKKAREAMLAVLAEYEQEMDKVVKSKGMTVSQWFDIWLSTYVKTKPLTKARYEMDVRIHIKPAIGDIPLADLEAPSIQYLYNKKEEDGLSLKSIKNLHSVVHTALNKAVELGYIRFNVSNMCNINKPPVKEMYPITDGDLVRFLGAIKESKYEDILFFMTFTGVRRAECVGLTWDCIDFNRNTIHVYRQWQKHPHLGSKSIYGFEPLKNNKSRTFKVAKQVMDVLKKIKVEQDKQKLACGDGWHAEHDFVFTHDDGEVYNADCVFKYFKRVVRSLGLENTRLHDLRHTFATLAIENGTDMKTVSVSLGHSTTAFTMDKYGHVSAAMESSCADRMENLISTL